ncbi:MAG: hypothetical protein CFE43_08770 [Burkholderiales bacterium PBB3]|nr:MAG: hypothetical protein CFE43_08770 [Burkholderiales bacterium PBB3]
MRGLSRYRWLVLACSTAMGSCTLPPPTKPARQIDAQAARPSLLPAAQAAKVYRIDPGASTLHVLVYRGGPMVRLGHNHVIISSSISGRIWQGASLENSGFAISVPVNSLIVDDNDARTAEGEDFPLNVTEDAKQATKANMLRETLLDGARYPDISIQSIRLLGDTDTPRVLAALRIKDQTRQIVVPVTLRSTDGSLRVQGEFEIKQTDFGIAPLSVALGALVVLDTLKVKFELVANTD